MKKRYSSLLVWGYASGLTISSLFLSLFATAQAGEVPHPIMQQIYEEIKTPYKYGLVMVPADDSKKIDCPSVFRKGEPGI